MTLLGRILHRVRAGAHRSPFAGPVSMHPRSSSVTSTAFTDGAAMPTAHAGKGVGGPDRHLRAPLITPEHWFPERSIGSAYPGKPWMPPN